MSNKKTALVFYSYSGNIKKIAYLINEIIDVDIFELKLLDEYPRNLNELIPIAKYEVEGRTGREFQELNINVNDYETIMICTPNWGDTVAPPILTFLRQHDLSGTNIIPVITHQGTGKGHIIQDIEKEIGNSKIKDMFVDYHKNTTKNQLKAWLKNSSI